MTDNQDHFVVFVTFVAFVPERVPSVVDTYGS
jgi:hypothetical protein